MPPQKIIHLPVTMTAFLATGDTAPCSFALACPSSTPDNDEGTVFQANNALATPFFNLTWCGTSHTIENYITKNILHHSTKSFCHDPNVWSH